MRRPRRGVKVGHKRFVVDTIPVETIASGLRLRHTLEGMRTRVAIVYWRAFLQLVAGTQRGCSDQLFSRAKTFTPHFRVAITSLSRLLACRTCPAIYCTCVIVVLVTAVYYLSYDYIVRYCWKAVFQNLNYTEIREFCNCDLYIQLKRQ